MAMFERGDQLPSAASVDYQRFIKNATATEPAKAYKKIGVWPNVHWKQITPGETTVDFTEYAGIDLVTKFETGLT